MNFVDFIMFGLCAIVTFIFVGGFIFLFSTELRNDFIARGRLSNRMHAQNERSLNATEE